MKTKYFRIVVPFLLVLLYGCPTAPEPNINNSSSSSSSSSDSSDPSVSYTVTFNDQGADTPSNPSSKEVISGMTIGAFPTPPIKTGYTFAGWVTEGRSLVTSGTTICSNFSVYAVWSTANLEFVSINDNTAYMVSKGTANTTGTVVIPDYWMDKPVKIIGSSGFIDCITMTNIIIPKNISIIEDRAFQGCKGLKAIPDMPGINFISGHLFMSCDGLTDVIIPSNVKIIDWYAFYGCTGITNVTLSDGVETMYNDVFSECSNLVSVSIPKSFKQMCRWAYFNFVNCTKLENISVDENNTNYSSLLGVLFDATRATLYLYPSGKKEVDYFVLHNVTNIISYAFSGCRYLSKLKLPSTISSIGVDVFFNCDLTDLSMYSIVAPTLPNSFDVYGYDSFDIPKCKLHLKPGANGYNIPPWNKDGVTQIFDL